MHLIQYKAGLPSYLACSLSTKIPDLQTLHGPDSHKALAGIGGENATRNSLASELV
jgi:hypothetical protein